MAWWFPFLPAGSCTNNCATSRITFSRAGAFPYHAACAWGTGMKNYILDMDGVIYRGNQLVPGAREFIEKLQAEGRRFLFLTNNSKNTPLDFQRKLERMGLNVTEEHYFTSGMATAAFLHSQKPHGSA